MPLEECQSDPRLSKVWGCEGPSQIEAAAGWIDYPALDFERGGVTYEFFTHPLLLIPDSIKRWSKQLRYAEKFPSSVLPYDKQDARWVECFELYDYYMGEFRGNR